MATRTDSERVPCYTCDNYVFPDLQYKKGRKKRTGNFIPIPVTFDIETSSYKGIRNYDDTDWIEHPYAIMYHWQFCFNGDIIMGRTWGEFQTFIDRMVEQYHCDANHRIIIYAHNLGFEWQHMQCFIDGVKNIFAIKSRTPLVIRFDNGLEFRCSYKLSNMSLEKFCENEKNCFYIKSSGDLNYDIFRTPDTPLTRTERMYCASDVKSLYHAITERMKVDRDDLEHIPLTSTGYVRRHVRAYCDSDRDYRKIFLDCRLSAAAYQLLRYGAGGGDTHANRYLSMRIWDDCDSFDVRSSYPYVMLTKKYPMTRFRSYGEIKSKEEFLGLINEYACVFEICFEELKCNYDAIDPIISSSKCKIHGKATYDNGRVLYAEYASTVLTDVDFKAMQDCYTWKSFRIRNMHISKYGMLPKPIRMAVLDLYTEKCMLSNQIETIENNYPDTYEIREDWQNLKYLYNKCKNRLNGIFGMLFTDPVRGEIYEDDLLNWHEDGIDLNDLNRIKAQLDSFYDKRSSFVNFQWGVWTTAHARAHLQRLQRAGAKDNGQVIYWDTDSIKGFNLNIAEIEKQNKIIEKECEEAGAYCDVNGKRYYLGIYEKEPHMNRFITLGAKKYAYEDAKGKLKLTVSGVTKKDGKGAKELGKLENFKIGFTFKKAAAKKFYYDDVFPHLVKINGKEYLTAASAAMLDNTYTLGVTEEYDDLIKMIVNGDESYEI